MPDCIDVEIITDSDVEVDNSVDAELVVSDGDHTVHEALDLEVEVWQWTLCSDAIVIKDITGSEPQWFIDMVNDAYNDDWIHGGFNTAQLAVDALELGYTNLVSITDTQATHIQGLKVATENNAAGILRVESVMVTPAMAQLISSTTMAAWINGGEAGTWFQDNIRLTATSTASNALKIVSIGAVLDGVEADISIIYDVSVTKEPNPAWIGPNDPDANGEHQWLYYPKARYALTATAGGIISGFEALASRDGNDGYTSQFKIYADKFWITNGAETYSKPPFEVVTINGTPKINMTAEVSFMIQGETPTGENTTVINGGFIKANTIQADRLMAGEGRSTVWEGGGLISSTFDGVPHGPIGSPTKGFRLSSNAIGQTTDPNIYGAYIKGGVIEATIFLNTINILVTKFAGVTEANHAQYIDAKDIAGNYFLETDAILSSPKLTTNGTKDLGINSYDDKYYRERFVLAVGNRVYVKAHDAAAFSKTYNDQDGETSQTSEIRLLLNGAIKARVKIYCYVYMKQHYNGDRLHLRLYLNDSEIYDHEDNGGTNTGHITGSGSSSYTDDGSAFYIDYTWKYRFDSDGDGDHITGGFTIKVREGHIYTGAKTQLYRSGTLYNTPVNTFSVVQGL